MGHGPSKYTPTFDFQHLRFPDTVLPKEHMNGFRSCVFESGVTVMSNEMRYYYFTDCHFCAGSIVRLPYVENKWVFFERCKFDDGSFIDLNTDTSIRLYNCHNLTSVVMSEEVNSIEYHKRNPDEPMLFLPRFRNELDIEANIWDTEEWELKEPLELKPTWKKIDYYCGNEKKTRLMLKMLTLSLWKYPGLRIHNINNNTIEDREAYKEMMQVQAYPRRRETCLIITMLAIRKKKSAFLSDDLIRMLSTFLI